MKYDFIAVPDADVPQAVDPVFQHVPATYATETNKTASVWRAVPDGLLDFKPHEPSGDVKWDEADPSYSLEAARRGG